LTAAVIILAIALLLASGALVLGGSSYVDIANRYVTSETDRRTLLVEIASLKSQRTADNDAVRKLNALVTDLSARLGKAQAEAVAHLDDAGLTDALNGVRADEVRRSVPSESSTADTKPLRITTIATELTGGTVPR
jgi:hypothetical protein